MGTKLKASGEKDLKKQLEEIARKRIETGSGSLIIDFIVHQHTIESFKVVDAQVRYKVKTE